MDDKERLLALTGSVMPLDAAALEAARRRQAELAKPPGSLGRLEDLSVQIAGITGKVTNRLDQKALLVFCADNGVVSEGVSSAPQSVTAAQTINLARHKTGASVLARRFGCRLYVCDVGVNARISEPGVLDAKIAYGTGNIAHGPAMTRHQAHRALFAGLSLADTAAAQGADVIGVGEMGIGNTTTSSAVLAVLTGEKVSRVTGRGGGITDASYEKKLAVIRQAVKENRPDASDVMDVLSKVGGFDLAAMTGAFLGAAQHRIPVVIDGFISAVAALCAARLCPAVRSYLFASHASFEIGYRIAIAQLGLVPLFDLGMRLGEGSGCPLAMMVLDAACTALSDMATFEEAAIDSGYLEALRNGDAFTVKGDGE